MCTKQLLVVYGSQTGTAQDVAEDIGRQAGRYWIDAHVLPMDAVGASELRSHRHMVLVMSTTGQGDTPDNMKATYRGILRKALPPSFLSETRFAIFGLGDTSYAKYNAVARRLWVRLQQLGAQPLLPECGLGDDQAVLGYDQALEPWLKALEPSAVESSAHRPASFLRDYLSKMRRAA
jgi:sulfite reductase alpha subunit-like flavoprotein